MKLQFLIAACITIILFIMFVSLTIIENNKPKEERNKTNFAIFLILAILSAFVSGVLFLLTFVDYPFRMGRSITSEYYNLAQ